MHISKKFMHKPEDLTRKVRLDIVAMHYKDMIKKVLSSNAICLFILSHSASKSWI